MIEAANRLKEMLPRAKKGTLILIEESLASISSIDDISPLNFKELKELERLIRKKRSFSKSHKAKKLQKEIDCLDNFEEKYEDRIKMIEEVKKNLTMLKFSLAVDFSLVKSTEFLTKDYIAIKTRFFNSNLWQLLQTLEGDKKYKFVILKVVFDMSSTIISLRINRRKITFALLRKYD